MERRENQKEIACVLNISAQKRSPTYQITQIMYPLFILKLKRRSQVVLTMLVALLILNEHSVAQLQVKWSD